MNENKERGRYDRKALSGVFKETTLKNVKFDNIKSSLENVILDQFLKKDGKKNFSCNIIIQYKMEKIVNSKEKKEFTFYHHSNFQEKLKSPSQIIDWIEREVSGFDEAALWTNNKDVK